MAIIKNLIFCSKDRLKNLTSFVNFECNATGFVPFPLDILHYMLPFKMKFLKESYVAIDNGKTYGLITLEKDDNNKNKLKISQLFLEENSIEYGELLINYVVNKFFAKGAESFSVVVDEADDKMLKLVSDVCKFRILADEYLFKIKKSDFSYQKDTSFEYIRFSKNSECVKISEFCNSLISSHQLPIFEMDTESFKDNILVGLKNKVVFKYVLENTENKKIFGYFTVSTRNNKDFALDAILASGYEVYLADILKFVKLEISKRNSGWTLYVRIKSCFVNHKVLLEILENYDFKCYKKSKILVKSLYKTVKADNTISGKQIIFNDITPAF